MAFGGPLMGRALALEGNASFVEALFLGLYLYGWDRFRRLAHWLCGSPVALSGAASGILVVSANGWRQSPAGSDWARTARRSTSIRWRPSSTRHGG